MVLALYSSPVYERLAVGCQAGEGAGNVTVYFHNLQKQQQH
jgi:hypothetical protein